jgi:hypothetical protein
MLDSPEGVCPGQARFEYPATFVFLTPASGRYPETSGSATAAIPPPQHGYARPEPVPEINVAQPDVSEGSTTTAARNAPRHARVRTAGQQPRLQVDASSLRRASLSDGLGVPRNRSACSCVSGVAVAARLPPHTVLAGMALLVGVLTAQPLPSAAPRTGKSSSRLESGGQLHVSWRQTVNVGAGREPHSSPHTALNATHAAHSPAHRWWWARHAGRFSAALRVRLLLVGGWGTAAQLLERLGVGVTRRPAASAWSSGNAGGTRRSRSPSTTQRTVTALANERHRSIGWVASVRSSVSPSA